MQIASILSDLTSLRVCVCRLLCASNSKQHSRLTTHQDHSAALALVSIRAPASDVPAPESSEGEIHRGSRRGDNDPDMERAMDLMELHHGVKMKHVHGEDRGLIQARKDVDAVLAKLENPTTERGKN